MNKFKKFLSIIFIFALMLSVSGCSAKEALPLNQAVEDILTKNGIEKSKITALGNFENVEDLYNSEKYLTLETTDKELQKFVDDLLLIHEEMIEVTDRKTVQSGDAIFVSYVVYYNSEIVSNAQSESLLVGAGHYGEEFEKAVIGAVVGEPFICELPSPVDTEKYKKGDILRYNITVESINYFVTYTSSDQYILDYYGFDNEKDFLEDCKMRLVQKKSMKCKNKPTQIF